MLEEAALLAEEVSGARRTCNRFLVTNTALFAHRSFLYSATVTGKCVDSRGQGGVAT